MRRVRRIGAWSVGARDAVEGEGGIAGTGSGGGEGVGEGVDVDVGRGWRYAVLGCEEV